MNTNADLWARRNAAVVRGVTHSTPIFAARAKNSELWDVEGKRYVDFAGGIAVVNTGHCHPDVIAAVRAQLDLFTHTAFQVVAYESYIQLAERLNALAPLAGPAKSVLFSTGAEATENAIKIARAATGRSGVIAFTGGFHGRTLMASTMTGKVLPYKKGMGAALPDVWHVPFPTEANAVSVDDTLKYLDFLFQATAEPTRIAAIIVEPVQGEGGFHPVPAQLMRSLRQLCDSHGIIFVADEVQTGFGRTGKLFAMEHYDVKPDLICVAKSLAGGFPLSGVIGRAPIMDAAEPGSLGGTYAGNPLACVAALAVLDVLERENLMDRANAVGKRLRERIDRFAGSNNLVPISLARGIGAMIAFDVYTARGLTTPDAAAAKLVVQRAHERGLIILSCGTFGNTIRVLVPLTVSDPILDEGLDILKKCLSLES